MNLYNFLTKNTYHRFVRAYFVIAIVFSSASYHAQMELEQTPREKKTYDSLEVLYQKASNDTLKIYYKWQQQPSYQRHDPEKAIRNAFKFFSVAKRANHPMSMVRCYQMIYWGYMSQAEVAKTDKEKEQSLSDADKFMQEMIAYLFDNVKGKKGLDLAFECTNFYRNFSYMIPSRSEFYLHRAVNGFQEILKRVDKNANPDLYISTLHNLAVTFQNKNRAKEASIYYLRVAEFCDSIKRYDRSSEFYNNLGFTYMSDGNFLMAQKYFFKSLEVVNNIPKDNQVHKGLSVSMANTYSNISSVFAQQRNYANAIEYIQKAVPLAKGAGENLMALNLFIKVADFYFKANNLDSSNSYISKVFKEVGLLRSEDEKKEVLMGANRIKSNILSFQGKHAEAIALAEKNLEVGRTHPNPIQLSSCLEVLGKVYFNAGQYQKAVASFKQQFACIDKLNFWLETFRAKCYLNIGKAYLQIPQLDSALNNLNKAKHQAELVNIKYEMSQIYQSMAEAYTKKGKLNDAITYLNKFVQYKDSFLGEQVNTQVSVISSQFQSNLKQIEEKARKDKEFLENARNEERLSSQRKFLSSIIIAISLLVAIMGFVYVRKRKDNQMLLSQKKEIEEQKVIVEVKNKEILDSIAYAKRIQNALFSSKDFLNQNLKENFILFKPKDIVSGDFYWTTQRDNYFYLAVCDSTGHGVPGAFMSLLNGSYLGEAINEKNILAPNEVFNYVRQRLVESMSGSGNRDGMDGVLVQFDKHSKRIAYAAAQNPMVLIRDNQIIELKADKMPVGLNEVMTDFTLNTFEYKEGDMLYIFTDGYADQFGGPKGKKFKYSQLYNLFTQLYANSMNNISESLEDTFETWKGSLEQIDDVCVVGIKF